MERDPFPMTSPEAQRLASSTGSSDGDNAWNSMDTESHGPGPKSMAETSAKDRQNLAKRKKKLPSDDIYADDPDDDDDDDEDDFLDHPLSSHRGSRVERFLDRVLRTCLRKMYTRLYGEQVAPSELLRTLCLATTLFFSIVSYWLLRSLKDPVLIALCGVSVIPQARMLSIFVQLGVVFVYNRLLDSDIPRYKLFYTFGTFYGSVFTIIALLLRDDIIGLANQQQSPTRILGWISYCSIESFGPVMVSLFWSFANSNISLETAKASYGVMVATAPVASMIGPIIVNRYAPTLGVATCYLIGAFTLILLQATMFLYIRIYGDSERNAVTPTKKSKAGTLEGLSLLWEHAYVKGIFAIGFLSMIELTIVGFTMKVLARDYFATLHPCEASMSCWNAATGDHGMTEDATSGFITFMGLFGQATDSLSFLLSMFGTSVVIRYLGIRLTLLVFPTLTLAVIMTVWIRPTLYVVFGAMMILKACSQALNVPIMEIMYQPTSASVRYQARSWIDILGARGSLVLASVVTHAFSDSATNLVAHSSSVGIVVASCLVWNARFMGKKFEEYAASGHVVGADGSSELLLASTEDVQMAMIQNEQQDTSCAI